MRSHYPLSLSLPFAAVSAHSVSPPLPSDLVGGFSACLCNLGTVPPPHYLQLYHKIGEWAPFKIPLGIPGRSCDLSSLDFLSKRAEELSPSVGRTSPINPFPLLKVTATATDCPPPSLSPSLPKYGQYPDDLVTQLCLSLLPFLVLPTDNFHKGATPLSPLQLFD